MNKYIYLFFYLILILILFFLIIINISIPWTGDIDYKLLDTFKNDYIKYKHQILNVPLNKKVCKKNLETIKYIFDDLNITFWLSEGTALGARRDGDFISHDDDVDIGMWYSDYNIFKKDVLPKLKKNRFTIDNCLLDNTFLCLSRDGEKIDIDFTQKNIKCIACITKNANCESCNSLLPYLKNMSHINILDKEYQIKIQDIDMDWEIFNFEDGAESLEFNVIDVINTDLNVDIKNKFILYCLIEHIQYREFYLLTKLMLFNSIEIILFGCVLKHIKKIG